MTDVTKFEKQLEGLLVDSEKTSKISAVIEKILSIAPQHVFALRCKVVSLLHKKKHAAALTVLDLLAAADPSIRDTSQDFAFQKAYCHYRMFDYSEAKRVLTGARSTSVDIPSQHLLAQLHYHLEEFAEAAVIYESLLAKNAYSDAQEKADLEANYAAACAAIDVQKTQSIVRESDEKTASLLYNAATAQVEAGDYTTALATLKQAEVLYAKSHPKSRLRSFSEAKEKSHDELHAMLDVKNAPEREFFDDVAVVWVQMAFVYYALQKEDEALGILAVILRHRPSSTVTLAVATINWAVIQRHRDFFDTYRKLRAVQNPKVRGCLTSKQRLLVSYNTAILLLHIGNLNRFRRKVNLMETEYPDSDLTRSLSLVLAVRESKKKRISDEKIVTECVTRYQQSMRSNTASTKATSMGSGKSPSLVKLLPLIAAQIFLENGDLKNAIQSLSSASDEIRQKPSTVATMVSWKVQIGDIKGAKELITDSIVSMGKAQKSVLLWSARFFLTRELYTDAVDVIRAIQTVVPALKKDREVNALLALCLSHYDVKAARESIEGIQGNSERSAIVTSKPSDSVIQQLESRLPSRQTIEALGFRRPSTGDDENNANLRRPRRRVMRRRPKNTEGRIDPERWIPMYMRSYIKDLPERRKRELKRLRANEQEQKRHLAEKRKAAAAAAGSSK